MFFLIPVMLHAQGQWSGIMSGILEEKWHMPQFAEPSGAHEAGRQKRALLEFRFTDNQELARSEGEPFIAVNPLDSNEVVVSFMDLGFELDFPVYYSHDGGDNWQRSEFNAIDTFKADFPDLFVAGGGDPIFAFDNSGRLYFSWIYLGIQALTGTIVTYWAWSDDLGAHFTLADRDQRFIESGKVDLVTADILNQGDGVFDRPWFAADMSGGPHDGTLYCTGLFLPADSSGLEGQGLVMRIKRPGVDTFDMRQTQISAPEGGQFSNVAVDANGRIHVSFVDLETSKLVHALLAPGGEEVVSIDTVAAVTGFSVPRVHARENPAPSLVLNPGNPGVYLSWSDFSTDSVAGYFSRSEDAGRSWTQKEEVSSFFEVPFDQVLMPVLAINMDGQLAMTWFGLNADDQGFYYVSRSADEGASWSLPVQVSGDTSDFSVYGDASFFGDYYKTAYVNQSAYIAWSDGRDSLGAKMYFARVDPSNPSVNILPVNRIQDQISMGQVFPSPGRGQAYVSIEADRPVDAKLRVYAPDGSLAAQSQLSLLPGSRTYSLPAIAGRPGIYILSLSSGGVRMSRRFIRD